MSFQDRIKARELEVRQRLEKAFETFPELNTLIEDIGENLAELIREDENPKYAAMVALQVLEEKLRDPAWHIVWKAASPD